MRQIARVPGGQACRSIRPVSSTTSAPSRRVRSGWTAAVQAGSGTVRIASRTWAVAFDASDIENAGNKGQLARGRGVSFAICLASSDRSACQRSQSD